MLGQVLVECGSNIARSCVFSEVGSGDIAREIASEIGTPGLAKRSVGAVVYLLSGPEFHLRPVVNARDAAESEHQTEVFRPLRRAAVEAYLVAGLRTVVVGIDVDHVPSSIVVEVVTALGDAHCAAGIAEIVVHGKVYHVESRGTGVVGRVVVVAAEEGIVGAELICFAGVVVGIFGFAGRHIGVAEVQSFRHGIFLVRPFALILAPSILRRTFPRVEKG